MSNNIDDIKKKAVPILKKAGISNSAIFGSFARGENTDLSDIDILIEVPQGMSLFKLGGLQMDLEAALKTKVDLVNYKTLKTRIKPLIMNEQIKIL